MPRRSLTDAERDERRAQQRQLMTDAVEALRSSDGWQAYLRTRRAFRAYSPRNVLLIALQHPAATRVAGFRAWLDLGYCVVKGETAIRIWAPCPPSKKQIKDWRDAGADPEHKPRTHWKLAAVFAQDQVSDLPPPAVPAPLEPPEVLAIEGDSHAALLAELAALAQEIGYGFEIAALAHGPEGICRHTQKQIVVAEHLTPNGRLAAGVHELAHALTHTDDLAPHLSYAEEELVVESVAYCVCQTVGLATDVNSIPYLASWAQEASLEVLQQAAELCDRLARRIEDVLLATSPGPDVDPEPATAPTGADIQAHATALAASTQPTP